MPASFRRVVKDDSDTSVYGLYNLDPPHVVHQEGKLAVAAAIAANVARLMEKNLFIYGLFKPEYAVPVSCLPPILVDANTCLTG